MNTENNTFKVRVLCYTYNHASYILDALNGFTIQRTNFPFVCIVVDDASTDDTPLIINEFIEENCDLTDKSVVRKEETDDYRLTYARHKTNENCYFATICLKYNHYSIKKPKAPYFSEWTDTKYVAQCEGDDYWIDPKKLQKQAEYMDSHGECILCGTNGLVLWDEGTIPPRYFNNIFNSRELLASDIIGKWALPTPSLFYRRELVLEWPNWTKEIYSGDQTKILMALYRGTVYCLKDLTCVYRRNNTNLTSISNMAKKKALSFETEQHLILYKEFDKYTNHVFQPLIGEVIFQLEQKKQEKIKRASFYEIYRCSKVKAFLRYPFFFTKLVKEKIENMLMIKRSLK